LATPLIVIPDDSPPVFSDHSALDRLREVGELRIFSDLPGSREELIRRLNGATAAIDLRSSTVFDEPLLVASPNLRLIAIVGTGTDNIDLDAASRCGVAVCNTPGANARSVAEHAIALMLAAAKHIALADREMRAGEWRHHLGLELEGKTLGVVGLGNIGSRVARMGNALGMRVVAWSFTHDQARAQAAGAELVDLNYLLCQSDVVSLHVPATTESRGMVGARELALMKSGAILVNTARGALVDEAALIEALRTGRLGGAGLDVFVDEPLPSNSPLLSLSNVVLTPHAAWVTDEAQERLIQQPIDNVLAFLAGNPRNIVNPKALEHPKQRMDVGSG
jgi:D-3-phosphoglycerate dehydrogenase / 2-oxoglutarate reductase